MLGFESRIVFAATNQDGRNWKLNHPVTYHSKSGRVFIIPVGAPTDGASTPAILHSELPPTGDYWLACVLHDSAYRNTLQNENCTLANLSRDESDSLLLEAMELTGVDGFTAKIIYEGVRMGGQQAFEQGHS